MEPLGKPIAHPRTNMISLKQLLREVLSETMTFNQLLGSSDQGRARRSTHVSSKSVRVTTIDEDEAWTFSYKSQGSHSTTGKRWHGYVRFLKDNVAKNQTAANVECMVDCDCPDYKYRFAYNNARAGAGITGAQSWNGNNGNPPRPREQGGVGDYGNGLCKHLISLGRFLQTEVEPDQPQEPEKPEPTAQPQQPTKPQPKPQAKPEPKPEPQQPEPKVAPEPSTDQEDPDPTMMAAPQPSKPTQKPAQPTRPDPTYTDSRAGDDDDDEQNYSDSRGGDLVEGKVSNLFRVFEKFAKTHPQFDVPVYEDETKSA